MKKYILFTIIFVLGFGLYLAPAHVSAKDDAPLAATVAADDSSSYNPTLLPTSRFYFLKEWKRSIQKLFIRNPAARAKLESRIFLEKAIELEKVREVEEQNAQEFPVKEIDDQENDKDGESQVKVPAEESDCSKAQLIDRPAPPQGCTYEANICVNGYWKAGKMVCERPPGENYY